MDAFTHAVRNGNLQAVMAGLNLDTNLLNTSADGLEVLLKAIVAKNKS